MAFTLVDGQWVDEETGQSMPATAEQQNTVPAGSTMDDWLALAKGGLSVLQTAQLNQINVQRAKMGLAPIDTTRYTGMGVNVGLSPQTQQLVIYGGLALLAVLLFNSLSRRG